MLPLRFLLADSSLDTLTCAMPPEVVRAWRSSGGGVLKSCCNNSKAPVTTLWS